MNERMITHRCKGSLKAGMSIRFAEHGFEKKKEWGIYKPTLNFEWMNWVLEHISAAKYCPFCGINLDSALSCSKEIEERRSCFTCSYLYTNEDGLHICALHNFIINEECVCDDYDKR